MRVYHTTGHIIQRAAWLPLRLIFSIFLKMEFQGAENLKNVETNAIFAANHTNEFDALVIVSCLPFFSRHLPLIFVSREKSFYEKLGWRGKLYGGSFFKLMGALHAYTGLNDYNNALKHHIEALKIGRTVCIFPMGKMHLDGDTHKAKGGVAYLAGSTGLPIIPVRITGIEHMTRADFWKRRRKLRVIFGKPTHFKNLTKEIDTRIDKDSCESVAACLMDEIANLD